MGDSVEDVRGGDIEGHSRGWAVGMAEGICPVIGDLRSVLDSDAWDG